MPGGHRFICITVFKFIDDSEVNNLTSFQSFHWNEQLVKYSTGQREICPDTGRYHIQLYVEFKSPVSFGTAKEACGLHASTHMERTRGTRVQAREYCRKDDTRDPVGDAGPWEYPCAFADIQAPANEFHQAVDMVVHDHSIIRVAAEMPYAYVRHYRGLSALLDLNGPVTVDDRGSRNIWIYGLTNIGKSHWAHALGGASLHTMMTPFKAGWSDGYQGEDFILFEDVTRDDHPEIGYLLRLADKWPVWAPKKGGRTAMNHRHVIITSNSDLETIYFTSEQRTVDALARRFVQITAPDRDGLEATLKIAFPEYFPPNPPAQAN